MSDTRQKLKEMAQLSILANRISEVQEKNLKMYPFVFFDGVSIVSIDYDLGHGVDEKSKEVHHKSLVAYHLTLDEKANERLLEKRLKTLEISVRAILWQDIIVKVFFNSKLVYESKDV